MEKRQNDRRKIPLELRKWWNFYRERRTARQMSMINPFWRLRWFGYAARCDKREPPRDLCCLALEKRLTGEILDSLSRRSPQCYLTLLFSSPSSLVSGLDYNILQTSSRPPELTCRCQGRCVWGGKRWEQQDGSTVKEKQRRILNCQLIPKSATKRNYLQCSMTGYCCISEEWRRLRNIGRQPQW